MELKIEKKYFSQCTSSVSEFIFLIMSKRGEMKKKQFKKNFSNGEEFIYNVACAVVGVAIGIGLMTFVFY